MIRNTSSKRQRVGQTREKTRAVTHLLALRAGIETTCRRALRLCRFHPNTLHPAEA